MRRRRLLVLVVLAVPVIALGTVGTAHAQSAGEHIADYGVDITVRRDGTLTVRETIVYDFGPFQKHGIFRDIPVRFDSNKKGFDRVYPLDVTSVRTSKGTPSEYRVETVGNQKRIRIGDPDSTITGRHTYQITYGIRGVPNAFKDRDEIVWNVVGAQWSVPIDHVSARVEAPSAISRVGCASGSSGSNTPCTTSTVDGNSATFTQGDLFPFQGLTVTLALPAHSISPRPKPILDERFSLARAFEITPLTGGVAGALLVVVIVGFAFFQYRFGRDRRYTGSAVDAAFGSASGADERVPLFEHEETPVEFVPPDGLRPGQIGTLVDFVANPLDVTATIVDLAVRGYLTIEEVPPEGGLFHKPDWKLTKRKSSDDLKEYERSLMEGLFQDGDDVQLSDLRNHFARRIRKVQEQLGKDAIAQGWFVRPPSVSRVGYGCLGILVLLLGVGLLVPAVIFTHLALLPVPIVLAGVLLTVGAYWMPQRTAKGSAVLRRSQGFRRFIEESEAQRARFAEQKNLFSEYLPYAIVFGATKKWAHAFAGLDGEPPETSSWYVATTPFSIATFGDAIDGFTVTTSGTLTSTPASTSGASGFSGGGSVGGGAGGGGGGSW